MSPKKLYDFSLKILNDETKRNIEAKKGKVGRVKIPNLKNIE